MGFGNKAYSGHPGKHHKPARSVKKASGLRPRLCKHPLKNRKGGSIPRGRGPRTNGGGKISRKKENLNPNGRMQKGATPTRQVQRNSHKPGEKPFKIFRGSFFTIRPSDGGERQARLGGSYGDKGGPKIGESGESAKRQTWSRRGTEGPQEQSPTKKTSWKGKQEKGRGCRTLEKIIISQTSGVYSLCKKSKGSQERTLKERSKSTRK